MDDTLLRDLSVAVYAVLFAGLAIRALIDWRATREAASIWFSVAFGVLALVVITSAGIEAASGDEPAEWASRLIIALLALYPPSLLAFAYAFGVVSRAERRLAFAWFGLLAAWTLTVLDLPAAGERGGAAFGVFTVAFVAGWLLASVRVVVSLLVLGRRRAAVARGRMHLLAIGFALLDVSLLLQAIGVDGDLRTPIAIISAVSAICSALGFSPPGWLRAVARRRDEQQLRAAVARLASAVTERDVLEALLPSAQAVLGAPEVAMVPFDEAASSWVVVGYDEVELAHIRNELEHVELPEAARSVQANGRVYAHTAASWIVVQRPRAGSFFGDDELQIIGSIDAIVQLAIARIRDAAAVRDHEQLLQAAIDMAELGKWRWSVGADEVWWSPRMYEIFGADPRGGMSFDRYRELLAPEERDRVATIVDYAVREAMPYEVRHRVVRPDGGEVWVHSRGRVMPADATAPKRVIGITSDITDQVRLEQQLRDTTEALRAAERGLREQG